MPTALLDDATLVRGLQEALDRWGEVVIKPRTGAGGVGVVVASSVRDERLEGLTAAPWVVQPLVESVRTTGETSVYVLGGRAVSQVDKVVAGPGERDPGARAVRRPQRRRATSAPSRPRSPRRPCGGGRPRWGADLDLRAGRHDGAGTARWAVSELELIEPGLYLDVDPANAGRFADLVRSLL